ncbi:MAG: hypothetical protein OMM_05148 [Candidatus Magnetoglobus multicellularis str. Araruama]|uniref:Fibronectin type-III domain-containing protein n=1 Tax=Candidatus Magnetoglobus multicellularis str. Araruama TaxID=890399 RepID=A0A1V1NXY3_9BACT|nr:MAG: hypothetical protein OMM_05148 [Candidatus Magnetoglobus multicellularis str. Araruama]
MLKIVPENASELYASQGLFCITDFVPKNLESQSHQIGICNTDMTIEISWESPNVWGKNIEAYRVLWDHSSNTVPENGDIIVGNIHSSPNLSEGNQHYVHIRVKDDQGHWGNNAAHLGPFCIKYPDVESPKGLQVTSAQNNTIELEWYHMDAVFNVYRSYSADGFYIKCDPSELTDSKFTDTRIIENKRYWYKISAINNQGEESFLSDPVSAMCNISTGDIKLKCDDPHQMQIAGSTAIFKILVNTGGSLDDQITMVADGLGENMTISFTPKILSQTTIVSLFIDISDQQPAEHYDFNVTAISDNDTSRLPLFLDITNPPSENTVISAYANPDSVQLSETVHIYGNIRPPQKNVSVWVYIKHESDENPFIYQTTSNEDANFNIQYLPSKTGKYMAYASLDNHQTLNASQSLEIQFTVLRGSARLSCMVSKEKELTNQGLQVSLTGKLYPAFKDQVIGLEK